MSDICCAGLLSGSQVYFYMERPGREFSTDERSSRHYRYTFASPFLTRRSHLYCPSSRRRAARLGEETKKPRTTMHKYARGAAQGDAPPDSHSQSTCPHSSTVIAQDHSFSISLNLRILFSQTCEVVSHLPSSRTTGIVLNSGDVASRTAPINEVYALAQLLFELDGTVSEEETR